MSIWKNSKLVGSLNKSTKTRYSSVVKKDTYSTKQSIRIDHGSLHSVYTNVPKKSKDWFGWFIFKKNTLITRWQWYIGLQTFCRNHFHLCFMFSLLHTVHKHSLVTLLYNLFIFILDWPWTCLSSKMLT